MDKIYGFKDNFGKVEVPSLSAVQQTIGIKLFCDNNVFRVDDKGTPMPSEQIAHIRLLKGLITDPVVWTKDGKTVEATDSLDVSVSDMAYPQAVLKNIDASSSSSTEWKTGGTGYGGFATINYAEVPVVGHKYYVRCTIRPKNDITEFSAYVLTGVNAVISDNNSLSANTEKTYGGVGVIQGTPNDTKGVIARMPTTAVVEYKEHMTIDVTELSKAYPQHSNEQLAKILDESLPYISAGQSVSIGGLMRIENVYSDDKPWEAGSLLTNVENTDDYIRGTITGGAQGYNSWILRSPKDITGLLNHKVFLKASVKSSVNQYSIGFASSAVVTNIPYLYAKYTSEAYGYTNVFSQVPEANTLTLYKKETFAFDATSSGLDLWLALNGYDTDKKKADWCNAHIPFFEGETNICVSVRNSLPVKVTAGAYEDTLTLQAVESLSTSLADSDILVSGANFIKFKNGTMIYHETKNIKTPIEGEWTAWGNIFNCYMSVNISFPLPFIKKPQITITLSESRENDFSLWISKIKATGTAITAFEMCRGTKMITYNMAFDIIAIGRWK